MESLENNIKDKSNKERMQRQIDEIRSPANRWFAGEHFKRVATDEELARYYYEHGGMENFAKNEEAHNAIIEKEEREKKEKQ